MQYYKLIENMPYGYAIKKRKCFFRWVIVEHLYTVEDCLNWIASQHTNPKERLKIVIINSI